MKAWLGTGDSGSLVDEAVATVSVFDHGYTVGEGLFETMKVVDGRVFLWPWHLERMQASATVIGMMLPSADTLTRAVSAVVSANRLDGIGRLRLTVTCGNTADAATTVVCTLMNAKQPDQTARIRTMQWPRNERSPLVGLKSTSYQENVLALQRAQRAGCSEALFFNSQGNLSEGSVSNVFVVREGVVVTPRLADGLLPGVTRRLVMTLGDSDLEISETAIDRSAIETADEVFITSSLRDIQPVDRIDDRVYRVGPISIELQRRFAEAAAADWCWLRPSP